MMNKNFKILKNTILNSLALQFNANMKRVCRENKLILSFEDLLKEYILGQDGCTNEEFKTVDNYYKKYAANTASLNEEDIESQKSLVIVNLYRSFNKLKPISMNQLNENSIYLSAKEVHCAKEVHSKLENSTIKLQKEACYELLMKYCKDRKTIDSIDEEDLPAHLKNEYTNKEEIRLFLENNISKHGDKTLCYHAKYQEKSFVYNNNEQKEFQQCNGLINFSKSQSDFNEEIDLYTDY